MSTTAVTLAAVGSLCLACSSSTSSVELPACVVPLGASPTRGPADAWVTIVEFGDFQCPYCGAAEPTIRQVDAARPGLRWVWKNLPLSFHDRALPTAIAAMCADAQGHFWEMHDLLYANQDAQSDTDLASYAAQIGLDVPQWQACLTTAGPVNQINADLATADNARVDGTPTFFVNGLSLVGSQPLDAFLTVIDQAQSSAQMSGTTQSEYYAAREGQGCR